MFCWWMCRWSRQRWIMHPVADIMLQSTGPDDWPLVDVEKDIGSQLRKKERPQLQRLWKRRVVRATYLHRSIHQFQLALLRQLLLFVGCRYKCSHDQAATKEVEILQSKEDCSFKACSKVKVEDMHQRRMLYHVLWWRRCFGRRWNVLFNIDRT